MSRRPLLAIAPRTLAALTLLVSPLAAQQRPGRAFSLDDALAVRTSRIDDVSKDGRWIALTVRLRRDGLGVNNARYGDPTYVAPSLGEFQLIDATNGKTQPILPGKVDVRGAKFSKDGKSLAFFLRKGDDYALEIDDVASNRTRAVALHTTKQVASSSELVWAPDGKSVLIGLRPDGWAAGARAAFVQLTEGEIVVQDARATVLVVGYRAQLEQSPGSGRRDGRRWLRA